MQIYVYYNIDCASQEETQIIQDFFTRRGMDVQMDKLHVFIESDESKKPPYQIESEKTHIAVAIEDWAGIAPLLGRDFVVTGTVDTSDVAGEYMDFRLTYRGGAFAAAYSDWYLHCDLEEYEDYEDFCETEGDLCTEEEFDEWQGEELYLLEKEGAQALVKKVPLPYTL